MGEPWRWWLKDETGSLHRDVWWAESNEWHLTVLPAGEGLEGFAWLVCAAEGGAVGARGEASDAEAARREAEAAAARLSAGG